jgi:hypothetical protein
MKVGITLPVFRHDAATAIRVARHAEAAGVDGVFVFDHLWPLGQPERPALACLPQLGALAVETERVVLGPLVARVGLVPDVVLVHALSTVGRQAPGRLVAPLGTGDAANRDENLAYGRPFPPPEERVATLRSCAALLAAEGVPVWVGGRSRRMRRVAADVGGWNAWGTDAVTFASEASEVAALNPATVLTWGGQVLVGRDERQLSAKLEHHGDRPGLIRGTVAGLEDHLAALASAGAVWAVCALLDAGSDPLSVELVVEAAGRANSRPGARGGPG